MKVWTLNGSETKFSDPLFEDESKQIKCLNAITLTCCSQNQRTVLIVCSKYWQVYTWPVYFKSFKRISNISFYLNLIVSTRPEFHFCTYVPDLNYYAPPHCHKMCLLLKLILSLKKYSLNDFSICLLLYYNFRSTILKSHWKIEQMIWCAHAHVYVTVLLWCKVKGWSVECYICCGLWRWYYDISVSLLPLSHMFSKQVSI